MNADSSRRNKTILAVVGVLSVLAFLYWMLASSTYNGELKIQLAFRPSDGQYMSAVGSLLFYLFVGVIFGVIPCAVCLLAVMYTYFLLHCRDKMILSRNYHPPYENEWHYGFLFTLALSWSCVILLVLLHFFGVFTISFPY